MLKLLFFVIFVMPIFLRAESALEQMMVMNNKILLNGVVEKTNLINDSIGLFIVNTGGYPTYDSSTQKLTYTGLELNKEIMYKYSNLLKNNLTKLDGTQCIPSSTDSSICSKVDSQGILYLVKYDITNSIPIGIEFYPEDILGSTNLIIDEKVIAYLNIQGIIYKDGKLIKYFNKKTLSTIKQEYYIMQGSSDISFTDIANIDASSYPLDSIEYSPDGNGGFLIYQSVNGTIGRYWKLIGEPIIALTFDGEDSLDNYNAGIGDEITVFTSSGDAIIHSNTNVNTTELGSAKSTWYAKSGAFTKNYKDDINDLGYFSQSNVDYTSKISNTCNYPATYNFTSSNVSFASSVVFKFKGRSYASTYHNSQSFPVYLFVTGDNKEGGMTYLVALLSVAPGQTIALPQNKSTMHYNVSYKPITLINTPSNMQTTKNGSLLTIRNLTGFDIIPNFQGNYFWTTYSGVISGGSSRSYNSNFTPTSYFMSSIDIPYYTCLNGGILNGTICEKPCTSTYSASGNGERFISVGSISNDDAGYRTHFSCYDANNSDSFHCGDTSLSADDYIGYFTSIATPYRSLSYPFNNMSYLRTLPIVAWISRPNGKFSQNYKVYRVNSTYNCPNGGTLSGSTCTLINPPSSICLDGYIDTGLSGVKACKKKITTTNCNNASSCRVSSYGPIVNNNEDKYNLTLGCTGSNSVLTYNKPDGTIVYKTQEETTYIEVYNRGTYFDINFLTDDLTTTDTIFNPDNFRDGTYFGYKCLVKDISTY